MRIQSTYQTYVLHFMEGQLCGKTRKRHVCVNACFPFVFYFEAILVIFCCCFFVPSNNLFGNFTIDSFLKKLGYYATTLGYLMV